MIREIEVFSNIKNVITVFFIKWNASLWNKSIIYTISYTFVW